MDLTLYTEAFQQDDQSWLGSAHGTDSARTITLDASKFTAGTHYPNGYLPSGTALGVVTAGGKYGPYDDAASDGRQTLVGFLFTAVKMRTGSSPQGALLDHGRIVQTKLPFQSGTGSVDTAGKTDLGTRIIFV